MARKHREWQIQSTTQLCDFEMQAAHEIFEFSKTELKQKMIEQVDEDIKRVEMLRDGNLSILEEDHGSKGTCFLFLFFCV